MSSHLVSNFWYLYDKVINFETIRKIKRIGNNKEWIDGVVKNYDNEEAYSKIMSRRSSQVCFFGGEQWLIDLMWSYMEEANKQAGWEYDIDYVEDMQLTKYGEGMYYKWHYDGLGDHNGVFGKDYPELLQGRVRKLSLTLLLNNEYEGGHFEFTENHDENTEVQRPDFNNAGSIIVFPSHLEHRVTEITKGTRNSLVAWFIGPPFR